MSKRRLAQVNEQLKREISRILRREVHDPRLGVVIVTGVEVTSDLSLARVYVRPGEPNKDWEAMMEGLQAAGPYVRRELGKDLRLRNIPELDFREDRTLEKAMRIERILDDVLPEEEGEDGPDDRERPGSGSDDEASGEGSSEPPA